MWAHRQLNHNAHLAIRKSNLMGLVMTMHPGLRFHARLQRFWSRHCTPGLGVFVLSSMLVAQTALAAATDAEITLLIGRGDRRPTADADWAPAAVNQKTGTGSFVRTQANSQMGLLMADRTQIRLNQNSQLQIKSAEDAKAPTVVQLNAGRAWSQARPQTLAPGSSESQPRLIMQTASATMSIRGTDWEVEIGPQGQTQLVVLSGTVEMANDRGAISVSKGEAAVAQIGSAPVKLVLIRPQTRVQWVSSWKPLPRRWAGSDAARFEAAVRKIEAGDFAAASSDLQGDARTDGVAALLLADILMHQGDLSGATALLSGRADEGRGDPRATAMLAYTLARDDRGDTAQRMLTTALQQHPNHTGLLLAQGDLAIVMGQADDARRAFNEALTVQPGQPQALFGLGLIESERENIRAARRLLTQALTADPAMSQATAELAAAETFAGNYATSQSLLDSLLAKAPDNYVALTARGMNLLQAGRAADALESLLKAGLVEPRYARAWLYSGVAFYQLNERERAIEAFQRAAQLDERDPAPHLITSLVHEDSLAFGEAVASARKAQENMPYLKSLNQLATNQKGSANLGSALANFGLEEWAGYYATEAYSPYWGGSHLFMADRQSGDFNKNSELFKGFLTEPTAFGASNRQSTLVSTPGHYGRLEAYAERDDWMLGALLGTFNGLTVDPVPLAYFVSLDFATADSRADPINLKAHNAIVGLGVKPRYDLGMFAFATNLQADATAHTAILPNNPIQLTDRRIDMGLNYKFAPDNQLWIKAGSGRQSLSMSGDFVSQASADSLNALFDTTIFSPNGKLDAVENVTTKQDMQLRHSFSNSGVLWSWGFEHSTLQADALVVNTITPVRTLVVQQTSQRVDDAYVSARYQKSGSFEVQGDLFSQNSTGTVTDLTLWRLLVDPPINIPISGAVTRIDYTETHPRFGLKLQVAPLQSLRFVTQKWRRPASAGSLSPIDTVGIAVNDRLVTEGGLYERSRIQFDGEIGTGSFVQVFADQERVINPRDALPSPIDGFQLSQLESLRSRTELFGARSDLEDTPAFADGTMTSLGLAFNHLMSRNHTVSLRYLGRDGQQTGASQGLKIPYIPRHYAQLASQWAVTGRWLLGASATYRSERFRDAPNLDPIEAGWAFGFTAYWENASKRSSVQFILDNLMANRLAGNKPDPHILLRYAYRF